MRQRASQTPDRLKHHLALAATTALTPTCALAQDSNGIAEHINGPLIVALAVAAGLGLVAVVATMAALRARLRLSLAEREAKAERAAMRERIDRANDLLAVDNHLSLVWAPGGNAEMVGNAALAGELAPGKPIEAFAAWLQGEDSQKLTQAMARLRADGTPFSALVTTTEGQEVECVGAPAGGRAVLRLRRVDGVRGELAEARRAGDLRAERDTGWTSLAKTMPLPVWQRDDRCEIVWTNDAYAKAVESPTGGPYNELIDRDDRERVKKALAAGEMFRSRVTATAAGERRAYEVIEIPSGKGSAAVAIDVTDVETLKARVAADHAAHTRTLDQIDTAVAIFDSNTTLVFHNAAYRRLWGLDHAFLDTGPSEGAVLDKLREMRKLPEQTDFREWKRQLQDIYRAVKLEPREQQWHLPDGRTLRVVQNPDESGGVTYVFDDLTESIALRSQFTALNRVQSETLDHLKEAVAVFSSSGTLNLFNPALAELVAIPAEQLGSKPHIEAIVSRCIEGAQEPEVWNRLKVVVAGLRDKREPFADRINRKDGQIIDVTAAPLPDGGTLVTFRNVTADVTMQRTLQSHNTALEAADRIKTDFVKNVSYQLRTPLTTIIGFAQVLGDTGVGDLNDRQKEYLGYITSSSTALLAIINDILDLATVDAGVMSLDLAPVDVIDCMKAAAEGVRSRLIEGHIGLEIRTQRNIGTFLADSARMRQVLFNLLSNAIGASKAGDKVQLEAERQGQNVVFRVRDSGPGMDESVRARAFDRFVTERSGEKFRGVGLGLSIVRAFVELHKGSVAIASAPGQGTLVTVTLPAAPDATREAAE